MTVKNGGKPFLYPYFLGAYAENDAIFEDILLEFFRDHAFWRRNFHPENLPPIPTSAPYSDAFNEFLAKMKQELHTLSADLKGSLPFFSPRYLGPLATDLLLPGILAHIMTLFYNPNHVTSETLPTTLEKELEVGFQLARMLGFPTPEDGRQQSAWGHLTSGGTVSNLKALIIFNTVKSYPVSLAEVLREEGLDVPECGPRQQLLSQYQPWELFNFSIPETIALMRRFLLDLKQSADSATYRSITSRVKAATAGEMGLIRFFQKHQSLKAPVLLLPSSAPSLWEKAAKSLGLGSAQLVRVRNNRHLQMDCGHLETLLAQFSETRQPILAAVGLMGSNEFGSIDPIHSILEARKRWHQKGLYFGVHVDASWSGYLCTLFRDEQGQFLSRTEAGTPFQEFPCDSVYNTVKALDQADSVTLDPHQSGYLPFSCGAFVGRFAGVLDFLSPEDVIDFDAGKNPFHGSLREKLINLNPYILETSKPGAAAAAAYVTHRCIPLHRDGFGKIMGEVIKAREKFQEKLATSAQTLKTLVKMVIPFHPSGNIVCFAINPLGNPNLALTNHFSKKVYQHLRLQKHLPLQAHEFFVSRNKLKPGKLNGDAFNTTLSDLGIDSSSLVADVKDPLKQADHLFLFKHAFINPWLLFEEDGDCYISRYFKYLEKLIHQEWAQAVRGH